MKTFVLFQNNEYAGYRIEDSCPDEIKNRYTVLEFNEFPEILSNSNGMLFSIDSKGNLISSKVEKEKDKISKLEEIGASQEVRLSDIELALADIFTGGI